MAYGKSVDCLVSRAAPGVEKLPLLRTPEDALDVVAEDMSSFQEMVEEAIKTLRHYPHQVERELQEAIKKHPDLTKDRNSDKPAA